MINVVERAYRFINTLFDDTTGHERKGGKLAARPVPAPSWNIRRSPAKPRCAARVTVFCPSQIMIPDVWLADGEGLL